MRQRTILSLFLGQCAFGAKGFLGRLLKVGELNTKDGIFTNEQTMSEILENPISNQSERNEILR